MGRGFAPPAWFWVPAAAAALCVLILLLSGLPSPQYWHNPDASSGLTTFSSGSTTPESTDYPYVISPSWYPAPSALSGSRAFDLPKLTALGSGYALLNLSVANAGTTVWFTTGTYSPTIASAIFNGSACLSGSTEDGNCVATPTVPIQWSAPSAIATVSGTVTADALASLGTAVAVAVTVGTATTYVYLSGNSGSSWSAAVSLAGSGGAPALALDPEYLAAATFSGSTVWVSTVALGADTVVGTYSLSSPDPVQNLSAALVPAPVGYTTAVVVSTTTGSEILYSQLPQGGSSFSSWSEVGTYSTVSGSSVFNSVGATELVSPGGEAGQVAAVAVGTGLFVLYTSSVGDHIAAMTTVTTDGGGNWTGPYESAPSTGSIQDPTLAEGADGLTYAAWRVDNGT